MTSSPWAVQAQLGAAHDVAGGLGAAHRRDALAAGRARLGDDVERLVAPVGRHLAAARRRVVGRADRLEQDLLGGHARGRASGPGRGSRGRTSRSPAAARGRAPAAAPRGRRRRSGRTPGSASAGRSRGRRWPARRRPAAGRGAAPRRDRRPRRPPWGVSGLISSRFRSRTYPYPQDGPLRPYWSRSSCRPWSSRRRPPPSRPPWRLASWPWLPAWPPLVPASWRPSWPFSSPCGPHRCRSPATWHPCVTPWAIRRVSRSDGPTSAQHQGDIGARSARRRRSDDAPAGPGGSRTRPQGIALVGARGSSVDVSPCQIRRWRGRRRKAQPAAAATTRPMSGGGSGRRDATMTSARVH